MYYNRKPNLVHVRSVGQPAWILEPSAGRKKLRDYKARKGRLLCHKGDLIYWLLGDNGKVIQSSNVHFDNSWDDKHFEERNTKRQKLEESSPGEDQQHEAEIELELTELKIPQPNQQASPATSELSSAPSSAPSLAPSIITEQGRQVEFPESTSSSAPSLAPSIITEQGRQVEFPESTPTPTYAPARVSSRSNKGIQGAKPYDNYALTTRHDELKRILVLACLIANTEPYKPSNYQEAIGDEIYQGK
jgi:hypothetical protein